MIIENSEKFTVIYSIREHPDKKDTIIMSFENTGISLDNPSHKNFMNVIAKVVGTQMSATAQKIPLENIEF